MYYALIIEDIWTKKKSIYISKTKKGNELNKNTFATHKDYKVIETLKIDKIGIL